MIRRQFTKRMVIVILAGLVAVLSAGCMGNDDGGQSRRPAALTVDDKSGDPTKPTLFLTVAGSATDPKGSAPPPSGVVRNHIIEYGELDPDSPTAGLECASAAAPGKSCVWNYLLHDWWTERRTIFVHLKAFPSAGARVVWTGCGGTGANTCLLTMSTNRPVKATFVVDAKS